MTRRFKNEAGKRYGKLCVVRFDRMVKEQPLFLCLCECGQEVSVRGANLRSGNTKSCGCSRCKSMHPFKPMRVLKASSGWYRAWGIVDQTSRRTRWMIVDKCGHFYFRTEKQIDSRKLPICHLLKPTHTSWLKMIERCRYKKHPQFLDYGGRGITVCERWRRSFWDFFRDMDLRPKRKTLDRIDNAKGYCKDNCRWATKEEQAKNRRKKSRAISS